jgi:uncharacterized protein YndB with AHSA1/START domain
MKTNKFDIEIDAPVENVWHALTNAEAFGQWMKNVTVESTFEPDAPIKYVCFDDKGNILKWEGKEMVWKGFIKKIEKNEEFTCIYPDPSTGLVNESYLLKSKGPGKSMLTQTQTLISKEIADGYAEGTEHSLKLLKNHLEKK